MEFKTKVEDKDAYLTISGALDRNFLEKDFWVSDEAQTILKRDIKTLVVDMEGVDDVDTAGIAWMLNLARDAKTNNVGVKFLHIPPSLVALAKLSNVDSLIS
ncbi:STAS domain-containing protein [Agaribacter flavus]|uniref:Lipid asymmetry maintenance protein MlaB n=1 Tax=Agaribacter flavus TaxID=1902781 RepID=A0ABV7FLX9_9ALTE